ncbi:MAG: glycosyltransferase family 4 protein [Calditrichales bacterium]|nr:glycosyltransferase family 4 protein [Calditrichales bacterium]
MKSIRILFIESGTTGGGSFESLYQYLKIIDREKYSPIVIYFNETKYNHLIAELSIPIYVIVDKIYTVRENSLFRYLVNKFHSLNRRSKYSPFIAILKIVHKSAIAEITEIAKKERVNIVYLNNQIFRDLPWAIMAKKLRIPVISHLRSVRSQGFNKKMAEYANNNVDFFIANSRHCKKHWVEKGISSDKVKTLYNFVPMLKTTPPPIKQKDNGIIIIGCLANFSVAKGHEFLIKAFRKLIKCHQNYKLYLAGWGYRKTLLEDIVRKSKLDTYVKFLGYVDNPVLFYQQIDILIVPSQNEAFGRVILEGMRANIPVIATRIGGIPEIIEDGYNGLLIDYGNENDFVKAVNRISSDKELRRAIKSNGQITFENRFSSSYYTKYLEQLFTNVMSISKNVS